MNAEVKPIQKSRSTATPKVVSIFEGKRYLKVSSAALYLDRSIRSIRYLIKEGKLKPTYAMDRSIRFTIEELDRFQNAGRKVLKG